jgi:hypothetical protein
MAKIPGLTLSIDNVSQTIDLGELFDVDLSNNREMRMAIAQAIIDRIKERTEEGKDVRGNAFAKYSKNYIGSDEFAAFDKSASDINMTLTGNMLAQLDVIEDDSNSITIGWDDSTEIKKAYNHNVGDTVTRRQFFGITAQELNDIQKEFSSELVKINYEQEQRRSVLDIISDIEEQATGSGGRSAFRRLIEWWNDDDD